MKIGNQLKFGSAILILLVGITISCTRSLTVPVSPSFTQTTPTNTVTNTQIATNTPTNTPTNTCTATATNTFQFSPTNTPTATISNTPTNTLSPTSTATNTATSTPTTNPNIIADFEQGALQDAPVNGLSGYWYSVLSTGSTGTTALSSAGVANCASGSYVSLGGTTGSAAPVYGTLQGDFLSTTTGYNITTNAPANTNAFVFCIKSTQTTQVWFSVSDASTTQSSANAGVNVNVSTSWTPVTVCFNHMQSPNWAPASIAGHIFDPTTAISFSWQVTAASTPYDIEVDNFQFAQVGGAACPTFSPTPTPDYSLIDDFEGTGGTSDNTSGIYSIQDENGQWRDGYLYAASDGGTVITSGAGNPGTAAEYSTSFSSYMQLVFTFINSGGPHYSAAVTTYDATVGGRYHGISFSARANGLPATICTSTLPMWVDFKDNQTTSDHFVAVPLTTAWQNYTVYFDQAGFDQNLDGSSAALNPVSIMNVSFQPKNLGIANFPADFVVDNIHLVSATDPNPPAAVPAALIDDFENGTNQVILNAGGQYYAPTATGRSGYWFVFADSFGSTECPNGTISGTTVFPDSPGYGGTAANPGFAEHITGMIPSGLCTGPSYSNCPYVGLGINFVSATTPYDTTQNGWTGFTFYAKADPGTATSLRVGFPEPGTSASSDHYQELITITNAWAPVSITLQCTTCTPTGPLAQQGFGAVAPWTPTQIYGTQWEFDNGAAGQNVGLWIDNVSFY